MSDNITVGMFLKKKRKEKGFTLEQVGNYVGVTRATVSRWESNEIGNMRTDKVKSICECLGITTKEFLERSTTDDTNNKIEKVTPKEFQYEVKELLKKTTNLSEQQKQILLNTLDLLCSDDSK